MRLAERTALALCFVLTISFTAAAAPIKSKPQTAGPQPTVKRPQEVLDAIKKYEGGDPDGAFELLKRAAKLHAQLPTPRVMLANLYFSENKALPGRAELERAAVESPADPEPHLIFGDLALRERRISDAETQFSTGLELLKNYRGDPSRKTDLEAQCISGVAGIAEARLQWSEAQRQLSRLMKLRPANIDAAQRLASALFAQGHKDDAYATLLAVVKQAKGLPPAAMYMAAVCQKQGAVEEAGKWLDQAVGEAPQDSRAHVAYASWLWEKGELEKADGHAQSAEKLEPTSMEAQLLCGTIARYRGDYLRAASYFEHILEKTPGNLSASNQLALSLAEQPDPAKQRKALELATANAQLEPNNPETAATFGWVCIQLNQLDEAERSLKTARAAGNVSRDTAFYMARLSQLRGNVAEAQKLLKGALESKGPFAHLEAARQWNQQLTRN